MGLKNTFKRKKDTGSKKQTKSKKKGIPSKSSSTLSPEQKAERRIRLRTAAGLFLMLFGIYLLIAFVSYLFTWKTDQDKVFHFSWGFIFDLRGQAENMLGNLGASLSHQFFYNLFGLSSFMIPVFMLLAGINLFFKRKIFPIRRFGLYTFFLTLFISGLRFPS